MDEARKRLSTYVVSNTEVTPQMAPEKWFKGAHFQYLQTKPELRKAGFEPVLFGWKPEEPIIDANTRVMAIGSCFAKHFILWLGDHGFNRSSPQSPYDALVKFGFTFESAAVIAQQFRWAFGRFDANNALWIGKDQERFLPSEESRLLAAETLRQTDVLIITLGLSEIWYDRTTGEPMWRAAPLNSYDESRHAFKVMSVAETVAALEEIDSIRREHLPRLKILYTVSPIRLRATYRPISALTANCASKAILRAALDEFLRAHWSEVNRNYFYFPSYEIVSELIAEPFCADFRHLYAHVPEQLMTAFATYYTSLPPATIPSAPASSDSELRSVVADLEEKVEELQRVCDERMAVIEGLDKAARERLELIEKLHAELQRRPSISK